MDARRWAAAGTVAGALTLAGIGAACTSAADPEQETEQETEQEQEQQDGAESDDE